MKRKKHRVLFVCLGNICRSPAAEGVMRAYVAQRGLAGEFDIQSAGISAHHAGEQADGRMQAHARRRGYELESISCPVSYQDFFDYDYIIGMDDANRRALHAKAPTQEAAERISLLTDWHPQPRLDHVPDPYYGGGEGFELVLDLIESCMPHLVDAILAQNEQ